MHYGRKSAHDVAGFAKENAFTSVVSFGEQEFNNAIYGFVYLSVLGIELCKTDCRHYPIRLLRIIAH